MPENQDSQNHSRNAPGNVHPLPALHSPKRRVMDHDVVAKGLGGADPEQVVRELGADELCVRCGDEEPG